MSTRRVHLEVSPGTARFLRWPITSDRDRSLFRARATRRLIEFWEDIKHYHEWTPINRLAPYMDAERRWVRRNLYTLYITGLVDVKRPGKGRQPTLFKVLYR